MGRLVAHGEPLGQWVDLVADAQQAADCVLHSDIESYLVFTLMRHIDSRAVGHEALGHKYLQILDAGAHRGHDELRDLGDQCLLTAGLFPGRAMKRLVRIGYFVDLGRSAYHQLSEVADDSRAEIYHQLSATFVHMMDVLLAMREMAGPKPCLDPVCAWELWNDTGSRHALKALQSHSNVIPFHAPSRRQ